MYLGQVLKTTLFHWTFWYLYLYKVYFKNDIFYFSDYGNIKLWKQTTKLSKFIILLSSVNIYCFANCDCCSVDRNNFFCIFAIYSNH